MTVCFGLSDGVIHAANATLLQQPESETRTWQGGCARSRQPFISHRNAAVRWKRFPSLAISRRAAPGVAARGPVVEARAVKAAVGRNCGAEPSNPRDGGVGFAAGR